MLAQAGLGSRRAVEELILQGRVTVDGEIVRDLATKVDPAQAAITVDGERIRAEKIVYLAVYKPKGFVTTNSDPAGRPRVIDLVPELPQRVYPIGRLDEDSTGLILLTNDGELANRLAHPRYGVEKVYRVLVAGKPGPEVIDKLVEGVWLAEGKARARAARFVAEKQQHGEATMIELTLAEGKNREVRRMLAKLGHKVMRLTRIAVGPVTLKGLAAGQWRHLEPGEVALLRRAASGESVRPARSNRREGPARRPSSGPAPAGPRSGMGHLVGTAGGPGQKRPAPPRPERDRGRDDRRPGGVPRRGAVGSFAPPPTGAKGRRPARPDDGPDEVLVPPILGGNFDGPPPPPAGRGSRPGGPPRPRSGGARPPAGGRPPATGGPPRRRAAGGPGGRGPTGSGAPPSGGGNGPRPSRPGAKPPGPIKRRPKPLPKSRRSRSSDQE